MKENLKDKAYEIIKSKIINCEYKPNEFISEIGLMKEIDVGRTPIREALNKLEQEKLIRIIPKKGTLIAGISYSEIKNVYEVRYLLEPYIIRQYASQINKNKLLNFKKQFEDARLLDQTDHKVYEIDDAFHRYLMICSENDYFINFLNSINSLNQRIRILSGKLTNNRIEETYHEHIKIIDEILADNVEGAALAVEKHILKSKEVYLKTFL